MTERNETTIAIDAMGGDHGPKVTIAGAALALERRPDTRFMLFGDETAMREALADYPALQAASSLHHCE
ncbi:MAG: phosphate acyltransferase, partial [Fulvimarina manganoxydans]|nr:phosphate acyltransferase [Fulvimarina manganoxydans]